MVHFIAYHLRIENGALPDCICVSSQLFKGDGAVLYAGARDGQRYGYAYGQLARHGSVPEVIEIGARTLETKEMNGTTKARVRATRVAIAEVITNGNVAEAGAGAETVQDSTTMVIAQVTGIKVTAGTTGIKVTAGTIAGIAGTPGTIAGIAGTPGTIAGMTCTPGTIAGMGDRRDRGHPRDDRRDRGHPRDDRRDRGHPRDYRNREYNKDRKDFANYRHYNRDNGQNSTDGGVPHVTGKNTAPASNPEQQQTHENRNPHFQYEARRFASTTQDDERRIKSRMQQIAKGKDTVGYANYIRVVPKEKRSRDQIRHPKTPDPYEKLSTRTFKGCVRAWRRRLHYYDPETYDPTKVPEDILRKRALNGDANAKAELRKLGYDVKEDGGAADEKSKVTVDATSAIEACPRSIPT